jgi:hypothetical protein
MAHRITKIIVPISSMDSIALIKIHHVWDVWKVVTGSSHIRIEIFYIDSVLTSYGWVFPGACRYDERVY